MASTPISVAPELPEPEIMEKGRSANTVTSSSASSVSGLVDASVILTAVASIQERRKKGEGRAVYLLAKKGKWDFKKPAK